MQHVPVDLLDVQAFIQVAQTGGFARAAERLALDKSIVSRRVARLEAHLGTRLLTRSAQGAKLTDLGAAYFARASSGLTELEAAGEVVARALSAIAGPIRLTAPVTLGTSHLASALAEFVRQHPQIEFDISFDDRIVDLVGGGFDVAVRVGHLADSSLIARRLTRSRLVLVGAPAYLAAQGVPSVPADVSSHMHLLYANNSVGEHWRFRNGTGWEQVQVKARLRSDSPDMLRTAAVAGLGLTVLPAWVVAGAIETGDLVELLPEHPVEEVGVWAVMPEGRTGLARVRALVDFLVAWFAKAPHWDPNRAGHTEVSDPAA